MKTKKSFKSKVRYLLLLNSLLPSIILIVSISLLISISQWNRKGVNLQTISERMAEILNIQFENYINICDNIAVDGSVRNLFTSKQNNYVDFINDYTRMCNYLDGFYNTYNSGKINFAIYHNNSLIPSSDLIKPLDNLSSNEIKEIMDNNYLWKNNEERSILYKNLSNKESNITVILSITATNSELKEYLSGFKKELSDTEYKLEILNFENREDDSYYCSMPLKNGQFLVVSIPIKIKYKIFVNNILICFIICLIIFLLLTVHANYNSNKVTKQIYNLLQYINDEKFYIETSKLEETSFGEFDKIVDKIKDMFYEINKMQQENLNLQLQYAQSQINPHLLYNSLSVLKWDCMKYSSELAEKITSLANYYRASIGTKNDSYTFRDEIELIKKYVNVVSLMHETKYNVTISIDDKVLDLKTIQHIFQPFVENSILHGINKKEDGLIIISGNIIGDCIVFKISDNGYGMHDETIKLFEDSINDENGEFHGIRNTVLRIKYYYGEYSSVNIVSKPNIGTEVTITLKNVIDSVDE